MRALIINAESGYGGGPAIIANGIANAVVEYGGEAIVAYGRQSDPNSGIRTYHINNGMGLYAHVALTRLFDRHGLGSGYATKKLLTFMDEFEPEIVNLHNIHGYYINYELLFRYLAKNDIPVVWTFHDCWAFTGHCAYFDRAGCSRWKTECKNCPQKKGYPASLFIDNSKKAYEKKKQMFTSLRNMTIITPSDWLHDLVAESFLNGYPCKTIHNGIDLTKYFPMESDWREHHGLANTKMLLAVAATWVGYRKGLDDLLEVAASLRGEYTLVVVGLTKEQLDLLPDYVIGIQRTENREELVKIYSTADVFVNASVEDNFPTVILEALACGTPVVTYDTGGCKEALDETCGRVVEQKNIHQMIEAIRDISQSGDYKDACLKRISNFDHKKKYREYVDLFTEMIKE